MLQRYEVESGSYERRDNPASVLETRHPEQERNSAGLKRCAKRYNKNIFCNNPRLNSSVLPFEDKVVCNKE
jgi:hypothetical protein